MMLLKYKNHLGLGLVLYDLLPDLEKYVSVSAIPMEVNDVVTLVRRIKYLQFEPLSVSRINFLMLMLFMASGNRLMKLGNKIESWSSGMYEFSVDAVTILPMITVLSHLSCMSFNIFMFLSSLISFCVILL